MPKKFDPDFSNSRFLTTAVWICAGIGAACGIALSGAAGFGAMALAGTLGAIGGGIAIPAIAGAIAIASGVIVKTIVKQGAYIPVAAVMLGLAAAHSLFVKPWVALRSKVTRQSQTSPTTPAIESTEGDVPPAPSSTIAPATAVKLSPRQKLSRLFKNKSTRPAPSAAQRKEPVFDIEEDDDDLDYLRSPGLTD